MEFLNSSKVGSNGYLNNLKVITMKYYNGKQPVYRTWNNNFKFNVFSEARSPECPVIGITWIGALQYCNWKSIQQGLNVAYSIDKNYVIWYRYANGYRLPTEAEWEFAARGGINSKNYIYSGSNKIYEVANTGKKLIPVGQKKPNELGIFDMSGNAKELCWDWYGEYSENHQIDPIGVYTGYAHVVRGGGWGWNRKGHSRVAYRWHSKLLGHDVDLGFRPVLSKKNTKVLKDQVDSIEYSGLKYSNSITIYNDSIVGILNNEGLVNNLPIGEYNWIAFGKGYETKKGTVLITEGDIALINPFQ